MGQRLRTYLALAGLLGLSWGGVLFGGFQYDDFPNLLNDPATLGGAALAERLVNGVRPLTRLSHVLDQVIWGQKAGGWLLFNLFLHGATVAGVLGLARRRGASPAMALFAAALFAVQPAHGMTVAYVSGRAAGLMTALLVAAWLAHDRGLDVGQSAGHATGWRLAALTLYGLACMAKETALCFPILLAMWELSRQPNRPASREMLRRMWPYAVLTLFILAIVLDNDRYEQLWTYSLSLRSPMASLRHNVAAMPETLSLLLRPWQLAVLHAPPAEVLMRGVGAAICLAWGGIALAFWRRKPEVTLGMLWPVVALLPSHSVFAKADAVSESGLYLCWIGPSLVVAMCGDSMGLGERSRWRRSARSIMATAILGLALTCTWRTMVWGDPVRLWQEAVERVPASARAWNNLGIAYLGRNEKLLAREAFGRAALIDPNDPNVQRNLQWMELVN